MLQVFHVFCSCGYRRNFPLQPRFCPTAGGSCSVSRPAPFPAFLRFSFPCRLFFLRFLSLAFLQFSSVPSFAASPGLWVDFPVGARGCLTGGTVAQALRPPLSPYRLLPFPARAHDTLSLPIPCFPLAFSLSFNLSACFSQALAHGCPPPWAWTLVLSPPLFFLCVRAPGPRTFCSPFILALGDSSEFLWPMCTTL